ncbi:WxL domain-containing protein [Enterococcus sp. MJM12]|uniref:WxL domain-containing protein n=1 Tax=Candidatus Enterococcus myersii TaxID=2815322 RepID=A0ABS3H6B6_9ENTE|nr:MULTISPECIES: WxL domain-containing protein [Enterococcus]MBO0448996.1 WxL domain-containing protein [Enterococcus sp. MJM12]MCD1025501.1 WxL domain-containing protein [Enterococcus sp. SMC-9]MDT2739281.1 WxL domain-containing protein [Enterococcus canintestini]WHA09362.1 WxL domain-containing protein [Enterococcus montenegrensis]
MKNIRFMTVAALAALSLSMAGGLVSHAASVAYDSNGVVEFIPNPDPTKPVDPTNPDPTNPVEPVDPTDPDGPKPGTDGPLSIDYASSLDFGINKITNSDQVYYARAQQYKDGTAATPNYVQISDNRGNNAGWTLKVKQNGQFKAASALNDTLTGSVVKLVSPTVASNSTAVHPTAASVIELNPDASESLVMSAKAGEGAGTYVDRWGSVETVKETDKDGTQVDAQVTKAITLSVPGSTPKDAVKYSTTLTWSLSDVPGN